MVIETYVVELQQQSVVSSFSWSLILSCLNVLSNVYGDTPKLKPYKSCNILSHGYSHVTTPEVTYCLFPYILYSTNAVLLGTFHSSVHRPISQLQCYLLLQILNSLSVEELCEDRRWMSAYCSATEQDKLREIFEEFAKVISLAKQQTDDSLSVWPYNPDYQPGPLYCTFSQKAVDINPTIILLRYCVQLPIESILTWVLNSFLSVSLLNLIICCNVHFVFKTRAHIVFHCFGNNLSCGI